MKHGQSVLKMEKVLFEISGADQSERPVLCEEENHKMPTWRRKLFILTVERVNLSVDLVHT